MNYNTKLIFGYDVVTYNGEIPNLLNPKFLSTIHSASDFDFRYSGEGFKKRWNEEWPVYNSGFWNPYIVKKSVYDIVNYNSNQKWFYPIEPFGNLEKFFGNDKFYNSFLLENISSVALNEIKNGNGNLLINYIIDGGLGIKKENFQKLIKFTKDNGIPDKKVYLLFADFNLEKNIKSLGVEYNIIYFNWSHYSKSIECWNSFNLTDWTFWEKDAYFQEFGKIEETNCSFASYSEFTESISNDKKDFLFFSRHWKVQRLMIINALQKLGFDKNHLSWEKSLYEDGVVRKFLEIENNPNLIELMKSESRILDFENINKIAGYGFETKSLYLNSYVSLVTESIFYQEEKDFPSGYLSEKIWKPIAHSHPFILIGPANSLDVIRGMGYKTFHPFIDETYDSIEDDDMRMELIINEINKFANKTKNEKDEFLKKVSEIVEHNQKLLLSYATNSANKECLKIIKLLNEL